MANNLETSSKKLQELKELEEIKHFLSFTFKNHVTSTGAEQIQSQS